MPRKASTKATTKASTKTKKKAALDPAELIPANPITAEPVTTSREPDEPELHAAAPADIDAEPEAPQKVAKPVAPEGELQAQAEAADTFEQAFEERLPLERPEDADALPTAGATATAGAPPIAGAPPSAIRRQSESAKVGNQADSSEPDSSDQEAEPARLERLQKILSQAGIASRRHAEEMITQGRVQVNGKTVTELGTRADPDRDHIRVDGKLIRGAERHRYFVLNKPKGYVTTVSDPEGRPTVMEFFKKAGERLYPVGRLDYQSEGLLLVTNDGDLANKLTKAATGVEKTYLVKVSGQPSEEELDRLREGVAIDRSRPGEGRVHTSPATIREVRSGDNPWYEVVLTEGRNRELRKMFEEIGHHVEKIRRVGYGPLVLDVEPGQFRELEPEELAQLRLAAEGKWRKPKVKAREARPPKQARREATRRPEERRPEIRRYDQERGNQRPDRRRSDQPRREWASSERSSEKRGDQRFQRPANRPAQRKEDKGGREAGAWRPQRGKPAGLRQDWGAERPAQGERQRPAGGSRFVAGRSQGPGRSQFAGRSQEDRPRFEKDRPGFQKREDRGEKRGPDRRGTSRPPRREGAPPPRGRFDSSRTERPPRFGRPQEASTEGNRATGGYRGARQSNPQLGARTSGRPNRPSAPDRSGERPSRPPFKGASGRRPPSQPRNYPPRGPRGGRG